MAQYGLETETTIHLKGMNIGGSSSESSGEYSVNAVVITGKKDFSVTKLRYIYEDEDHDNILEDFTEDETVHILLTNMDDKWEGHEDMTFHGDLFIGTTEEAITRDTATNGFTSIRNKDFVIHFGLLPNMSGYILAEANETDRTSVTVIVYPKNS